MKSKDFFQKLAADGKIENEEYKKFLESVGEGEIPDSVVSLINEKFMTAERAAADPTISAKMRWENLSPVNRDLSEILGVIEKIDKYTAVEISGLTRDNNGQKSPDTYKQLEALKKAMPKIFDKLKVAPNDEESKKTIEDQKKIIQDLTEKFSGVEEETKKRIKTIEDESLKKFNDYKLNGELEKMVNSYTFADAYSDTKSTLTKAILGELKSKNHLALATKENGEEVIQVMELENGSPRPKFNGNTPVVIKSLLDEAFTPFLKKSNTDAADGNNGNGQSQSQKSHNYKVDDQQTTRRGANVSVTL